VQGAGSLLSTRESCNAACQWVGSPGGRESDLSGNSPRRTRKAVLTMELPITARDPPIPGRRFAPPPASELGSSLRAVTPVDWTPTQASWQ
jgi:hypothetical protein